MLNKIHFEYLIWYWLAINCDSASREKVFEELTQLEIIEDWEGKGWFW